MKWRRRIDSVPDYCLMLKDKSVKKRLYLLGQVSTKAENISKDDVRWLRAVMAMSSGGEQPVWDGGGDGHSIFASKLLDSVDKGEVKGLPLYQEVKQKVINVAPQIPGYGAMTMPGYDKGADFILK